jgi:signal transduction histidine kinase
MTKLSQITLSEKIQKISSFALLCFGFLLFGLFMIYMYGSLITQQDRQVKAWLESFPKGILTHLIESDYVPVNSKLLLMEQTGLFKAFVVYNSKKMLISGFGKTNGLVDANYIEIKDEIGNIWGFYRYSVDRLRNLYPFWSSSLVAIISFVLLLLAMRTIMRRQVNVQFNNFSFFLDELESVVDTMTKSGVVNDFTMLDSVNNPEQNQIKYMIEKLLHKLKEQQLNELKSKVNYEKAVILNKLSKQVAHDIRSPLAALSVLEKELEKLSDDSRHLLTSAISRIREIITDLLQKNKDETVIDNSGFNRKPSEVKEHSILNDIEEIISEKRVQHRIRTGIHIELEVDDSSNKLFGKFSSIEFRRIISNLLDNAVESLGNNGIIIITANVFEGQMSLTISDNGKGIPKSILPKLGFEGVTYGKKYGNGLGLYHARKTIESWNGKLTIDSLLGKGTTIHIILPLV